LCDLKFRENPVNELTGPIAAKRELFIGRFKGLTVLNSTQVRLLRF